MTTLLIGLGCLGLAYLLGVHVARKHHRKLAHQRLERRLYEIERSARF